MPTAAAICTPTKNAPLDHHIRVLCVPTCSDSAVFECIVGVVEEARWWAESRREGESAGVPKTGASL